MAIGPIQLLAFTFIGFWVLRAKLAGEPYIAIDTDWLYRRAAPHAFRYFVAPVNAVFDAMSRARGRAAEVAAQSFRNPRAWFSPRRSASEPFDPDRERAPLAASVGFIILVVVALSIVANL